ncbi:SDR family oxidoreductase [Chryseobacterium echinoideorum]|uniref:SDR family oxidoreductase n=1 Tax=Chryseobacterium echinoideorum TaxID=1549648 RepID=UPI0011858929|nr:SDR family oxidoreductase [Chryseobacterium echinoideorum]
MNFTDKNVVITGGSTGIGFATAKAFIEAGANVLITGRNAENLKKAEARINNSKLKTIVSDTSTMSGITSLEKYVADSGNKVDVLFLNAGTAVFAPIEHATEEDFDYQFNTNVKGYFFTLQKLIPHFTEGSSVVFNSSTVATTAQMHGSIYSATKGAVNKIAQIAANELAERKIRVNIVSPGPTKTEGFDKAVPSLEMQDEFAKSVALGRMGDPSEIAKAVLFLASDQASFITGSELLVDGGAIGYLLK